MGLHHGEELAEAFRRIDLSSLEVYDVPKFKSVYGQRRKYAVIVVDMLNDFVYGKIGNERVRSTVNPISEILDVARSSGVPVIYTNDAHRKTDFELYRWGEHAIRGTEGAKVIRELEPKVKDVIVEKTTYSGFHDTDLDSMLRFMGVNTLILVGIHTDICIRHTAADAFFRGYELVVPEEGVNSFTEQQHRIGLRYLAYSYIAEVTDTKTVKEYLKGKPPG